MSSSLLPDPIVRPRNDGLQLSYQLPQRVYDAKVYPVKAPNESTVIIYGHDLGIKILWRGGRKFKTSQPPAAPAPTNTQANGSEKGDDVIMISDSEEEEPAQETREEVPAGFEFEDEEEELDPSRPFTDILRTVDIPLGAKALGLTLPNVSPGASPSLLESCPPVSSTIVVAVACADSSTRVIALPLTPPADETAVDFQTLKIEGGAVYDIPGSVAITFTNGSYQAQSRSQSRTRQSSPSKKADSSWELLLATHSHEVLGTLSIYRIPLTQKAKHTFGFSKGPVIPFQQELLPSPANALSFTPSQYPSDKHSHLLVSFPDGHVKVYSCLSVKYRKPAADRRGRDAYESREFEGRWLVTLSTNFDPNSPAGRRKQIVDARWVLGGKGIMALQADGEWGVWDISGAGPGSSQALSNNTNKSASRSVKSFAVTGRIGASTEFASRSQQPLSESQNKFAPMTPSTRRVREDALFKGQRPSSSSPHHHAATRGRIAVKRANIPWDQPWDDSVVIWHGDKNVQISSLLNLWRYSAARPGSVFDSSVRSGKPVTIEEINLYGQNQNGVDYLPNYTNTTTSGGGKRDSSGPDILLVAEYQLILLTRNPTGEEREAKPEPLQYGVVEDETRLRHGELDLDGMDRMLASMGGSGTPNASRGIRLFS